MFKRVIPHLNVQPKAIMMCVIGELCWHFSAIVCCDLCQLIVSVGPAAVPSLTGQS